ncbi:MAG: hypothetical protein ABI397_01885 [Candidatus Saccharimonas sp.]
MALTKIRQIAKTLTIDRPVMWLVFALLFALVVYLSVVGLSIHPSDVTVYTRYSSFGDVHFYKSHWQYLLMFMAFGAFVVAFHVGLMAKLQAIGRRRAAFLVGWVGIAILIIACAYSLAVVSLGHAA